MTTATNSLVRERAAGAARGRWLMLIVLLAGQFMALLDVFGWLAAAMVLAVAAGIPVARTVAAAREG
jgi:hypothetical protein